MLRRIVSFAEIHAVDGLGLVGVISIIYGIDLISAPAAFIAGGMFALVAALLKAFVTP